MQQLSNAPGESTRLNKSLPWALLVLGMAGLIVAFVANSTDARLAADQDWSPFVLVTGLLLIGVVANEDGLFAAAGYHLARVSSNGLVLFIGAVVMIGSVTAVLNLDTSVAFLTPVLIYTARSRGGGEAPLLYGCLLLSNAGSLFLPGSNLTNLIVLGHVRMSGAHFFSIMWAPALAALVITGAVVALLEHGDLRLKKVHHAQLPSSTLGLGLAAVIVAALLVLVLPSPALAVVVVGVLVISYRIVKGKVNLRHVVEVVGVPVLAGLFGVAVALGTLGRLWSGPATLLSHLDIWSTAVVAALVSILVNNLPAASLLAARAPSHPFDLLIGLNLGPNLFVTGSLAWFLWLKASRIAGVRPSLARASRIGVVAIPLAMAAALAILSARGFS